MQAEPAAVVIAAAQPFRRLGQQVPGEIPRPFIAAQFGLEHVLRAHAFGEAGGRGLTALPKPYQPGRISISRHCAHLKTQGFARRFLDLGRSFPRRRTAADLEVGDLADHCRLAEKPIEAVGLVDEAVIDAIGLGGEIFYRLRIFGPQRGRFRLQQGGF
jgi:hypothetical protein